jgi:hypothetical protein
VRGASAIAVACLVSVQALGCNKPDNNEGGVASAPSTSPLKSAVPVDHLAPGELVEGKQVAYGVALPRDVERVKAVPPSIYARVHAPPSAVQAYFQARVSGGTLVRGPGATVAFDQVHAADPKVLLYIRIDRDPDVGSRIEVRDATPPPPELHANDEERWRASGLQPNGAIDPTTLH